MRRKSQFGLLAAPAVDVFAAAGAAMAHHTRRAAARLRASRRSPDQTLEPLLPDEGRVEQAPFHLAEAIREVAAVAGAPAQDKGLDLIVDIDPAAEAIVMGDVLRLRHVLSGLLSNAVRFTADGYVAIAVRDEGAGHWRIEVQDTGVGFDPADQARIFDHAPRAGGGLAICGRLVELMGGRLDAVSALGEGATFTLRLDMPLDGEPTRRTGPPARAGAERPLRILLADDHPANRKAVQVLFAEFDVDLVCTENGREACEAFAAQRFDLVLMDVQMPVMDGLAAVRAIRDQERARRLSRTPIVMLTADAPPGRHAASLAAGADLHMPKPIEASRLLAVLRQVAERQAVGRAA